MMNKHFLSHCFHTTREQKSHLDSTNTARVINNKKGRGPCSPVTTGLVTTGLSIRWRIPGGEWPRQSWQPESLWYPLQPGKWHFWIMLTFTLPRPSTAPATQYIHLVFIQKKMLKYRQENECYHTLTKIKQYFIKLLSWLTMILTKIVQQDAHICK